MAEAKRKPPAKKKPTVLVPLLRDGEVIEPGSPVPEGLSDADRKTLVAQGAISG